MTTTTPEEAGVPRCPARSATRVYFACCYEDGHAGGHGFSRLVADPGAPMTSPKAQDVDHLAATIIGYLEGPGSIDPDRLVAEFEAAVGEKVAQAIAEHHIVDPEDDAYGIGWNAAVGVCEDTARREVTGDGR